MSDRTIGSLELSFVWGSQRCERFGERSRIGENIFFLYLEDDGSNPGRLIAKLEVPFVVEYIGFSEDIGHAEFNASIIIALKLIEFKIFFYYYFFFVYFVLSCIDKPVKGRDARRK